MQVQSTSSHMLAFKTPKIHAMQVNIDDSTKTDQKQNGSTAVGADQSTSNAITGTTGSRLSAKTTAELIQNTQQVSTAASESTLPIGTQHHLDDIANNPAYATEQANLRVTSGDLIFLGQNPFPKNGAPASEWMAAFEKIDARIAQVQDVTQNRKSYYESLVAQDTPPAEISLKLFEFDANLPGSYNDAIGFSDYSTAHTTWSEYSQSEHDYLKQAIADANSIKSTG